MLDEPTATDDSTPADTAPPAKAPRRRRATKAAAAPAAESGTEAPAPEYGDDAPATVADAIDGPAAEAPAADAAPAKRVRKAPAKKATPRKRTAKAAGDDPADAADTATAAPTAAAPAADVGPLDDSAAIAAVLSAGEPVVDAVEDDPAVAEAAADDVLSAALTDAAAQAAAAQDDAAQDDAAEAPAPAKRTRTRRVPAVVTFQPPEPVAEAAEPAEQEAPAPRRRRRAGTSGAVAPSDLIPEILAPEPAAQTEPVEPATADDDDDTDEDGDRPRRRRRGRRGRGPRRPEDESAETTDETSDETAEATGADTEASDEAGATTDDEDEEGGSTTRRRRRRRRSGSGEGESEDAPAAAREPREPRTRSRSGGGSGATSADEDGVRGITGSTRMAAKRVRRQEGRDSGRKRAPILSEAEFLARREAVERTMVVRQQGDRTQIAVLEDGVLVEHYVTKASAQSYAGNVYLGKVQNVLPSMEAAFVDIGKGRNAVLYAGEVNYDGSAGGRSRSIESVLKSGQEVLVQVSKDPIGSKGARLTGQVSLPGRYLVYVPEGSMTGISRKLPEPERDRLKKILQSVVPKDAGVIIRTAAEGASEEEIAGDVRRLQAQWEVIQTKAAKGGAPVLLHAEPDLLIRVVRDVFNEDFASLIVQGDSEWHTIKDYVEFVAPDLAPRLSRHTSERDVFAEHRIDEQLAKALDRKVWLPSGGSLVIDRTEAMVVIDVNTGKYVGKGGNLEETVTRNNLEAAEEIARQLRLRDLGGIIVVDFIDMVLESNRDLVVRRLVECLGRDRTKHQVAEVTSLGLVQMTRKRVGQGLLESFSEPCERCNGRGVLVSSEPVDVRSGGGNGEERERSGRGERSGRAPKPPKPGPAVEPRAAEPAEDAGRSDEPAAEERPKRRRRGGRGAGAATVPPSDELAEVLAASTAAPSDVLPEVVPELADQPAPDAEDQPVLPPEVGSIADREPAGAGPAGAEPVLADADDALVTATVEPDTAIDDSPVAVEPPGVDEVAAAAPRRRRRATSRPAGPPAIEV